MTHHFIAGWAIVMLLAGPALTAQAPEDAAQAVAESWVKLVDAVDYGASWDEAATVFKNAVTKEQWTAAATGARAPLGSVASRTLASRQITDQPPPGAPAGTYAIIRYTTTFANVPTVNELVILILDGDRGWRVAGYTVRPG
ncbi:MAG: DUF4019 domain-containing protein [Acidobacteriota bacterium]|nr:DUF4019 domain-containing protein [Acidobacteriota bacterium]